MFKLDATFCRSRFATASGGVTLVALTAFLGVQPEPVEARGHHHLYRHAVHHERHGTPRFGHHVRARFPAFAANFAAIVVDANSGRTLYARNEHELRHPASVTKVMTLYLLFEQIEKGRIHLDSPLTVSAHAAAQAPTKLGLRKGDSISVENAIKAIVTRSANDIAVAVAEAIGGDEDTFAELMTRKAHALGMSRTRFVNASGLPNDEQVTTAYDLAILGRAIQDHFPRHYRYFATQSFAYRGTSIANHNHLLERVEGMDGIKTGYTRASGFNLLASVKRGGHHLVAVVMGGMSAAGRDRIMAGLIEDHIESCAQMRTAAPVPLPAGGDIAASTVPPRPAATRRLEPEPRGEPLPPSKLPFVPVALKPGLTSESSGLATVSADVRQDRPRPAFVSGAPRPRQPDPGSTYGELVPPQAILDGSTSQTGHSAGAATATPSTMRQFAGLRSDASGIRPQPERIGELETSRPAVARSGWMIQIGATDDLSKANELLARAKQEGREALESARPFTERIQKGSDILYRARFAGLEADTAELACRTLKRSGISCFVTKN